MSKPSIVFKPGHYFRMHDDIIDVYAPKIGAYGVAIYTLLSRHMNRKTSDCYPSIGFIARQLKLGHSTVKIYLRKIEKVAELIEREPRFDPEGDPTSNRYRLLDPSPEPIAPLQETHTAPQETGPGMGGSPYTLPPVTVYPTGRVCDNPEPEKPLNLEPEEGNQGQDACANGGEEETPEDAPAISPLPILPERPDDALNRLNLDIDTFTALETKARDALMAAGSKPFQVITPLIQETMVGLWEEEYGIRHEGAVKGDDNLNVEEGQAYAVCIA